MAESVDASVSNTDGETRPGSTPGLGTLREEVSIQFISSFSYQRYKLFTFTFNF